MERTVYQDLLEWKTSENRKPLVLQGARQVGKTWLMKQFGEKEYAQTAYVNFEYSKQLRKLFESDYDIKRILSAIELETGLTISPDNTLIILDEIQDAEGGITSLKYFQEIAPEYHIIAAGSLLGVELHKNTSFPVGKVDFLKLYPLSFTEFAQAVGGKPVVKLLNSGDRVLMNSYKSKLIDLLKSYFYVGGMPEAVKSFSEKQNFEVVRNIQENILSAYELDFSKHAPAEITPRIKMLWKSVVAQISKENRKFIYGIVREGARAKDFELALAWLAESGILYKCHRAGTPALPLAAYQDIKSFKIFLVDIGLLSAMCDLDPRTLLYGNDVFTEYKGALTEQYVFQQLILDKRNNIYYWSSDEGKAELDFLLQRDGNIVPIEVKATTNLRAKSLWSYNHQFHPQRAIRTSLSDYEKHDWLEDIPLYEAELFFPARS